MNIYQGWGAGKFFFGPSSSFFLVGSGSDSSFFLVGSGSDSLFFFTWLRLLIHIGQRGGGPSADLRQEFAQAAKYTSFQDRLMKFSGLALGTVLCTLK